MPEIKIYCPKCGEHFQAQETAIYPAQELTCPQCETVYRVEFMVVYDPDEELTHA